MAVPVIQAAKGDHLLVESSADLGGSTEGEHGACTAMLDVLNSPLLWKVRTLASCYGTQAVSAHQKYGPPLLGRDDTISAMAMPCKRRPRITFQLFEQVTAAGSRGPQPA